MTQYKPRARRFVVQSTSQGKVSGIRVPAQEAYFWFSLIAAEKMLRGSTQRSLYRIEGTSAVEVKFPSDIFIIKK